MNLSGEISTPYANRQIAHFFKLFDGLRRVAPGRGSLPFAAEYAILADAALSPIWQQRGGVRRGILNQSLIGCRS